jgi:hypothetical protein
MPNGKRGGTANRPSFTGLDAVESHSQLLVIADGFRWQEATKGGCSMRMQWDHWLVRLFMRLPKWFGSIESVRVGNDCCNFVRISFRRAR